MSNDPKQPQKTIMGWGGQFPVPGQPQPQPPQQGWPQQTPAPQAAPPQAQQGWPQQPQAQQGWPQQPQQPQWQQPPAAPQQAWQQPQPQAQQGWQQPAQQPQAQAAPWQQAASAAGAAQGGWAGAAMGAAAAAPAWSQQQPWTGGAAAPSAQPGRPIEGANATVGVSSRLRFIKLTYIHLFAAILAFTGLEIFFFKTSIGIEKVVIPFSNWALAKRVNWAIVLGAFSGMGILTHWLANHTKSKALHYIGLLLYVLAEAVIFVPLLAIVHDVTLDIVARGGGNPNILRDSAVVTLGVFAALTATVVFSKKDFSFLRGALAVGGACSLALIALSLMFGFNLGIAFACGMVVLASGQILYETSQIAAHDDPESYVGAALSLFSSIALLFWYVIQIVMRMRDN